MFKLNQIRFKINIANKNNFFLIEIEVLLLSSNPTSTLHVGTEKNTKKMLVNYEESQLDNFLDSCEEVLINFYYYFNVRLVIEELSRSTCHVSIEKIRLQICISSTIFSQALT